MAPWWVCGLLPLLAVAAAAAAAAEGNAEPLIRSPAQDEQDAAPAPAPSAEDRVTRRAVLVAGYSCYHHQADLCTSSCLCRAYQILMRREMNEERIVVCMGKDMARNPQNPRRGVIITAEENTEPLILLPTQNEHDAAPAPAPSVKDSSGYENYRHQILKRGGLKEGVTRWAVLVAGSSGYKNYGHQADVCHAYQILKRGGLKEETILVCMYDDDDLAKTPQNPRPGVIIIAEENTEPLILLATQNEHVAAPAPSAEERITRADPSGYGNYHHQILKRGGMNEERIMVCMYDAIAKNFQNPRPGVIVAAEENTEPLHDAAAAPAPSAEEGATTKRAVLVAGSYGYKSYRRQVMDSTVEPEADHVDLFDKTGLVMAGCLVIGGALVTLGIVFVYRVYRFITLEKQLRRRKLPFSLYPPKGTTYPAGDGHTVCAVCLSRFGWCARIAVLPACGHIFHRRCLRAEVALESPRCPMCRAAVA